MTNHDLADYADSNDGRGIIVGLTRVAEALERIAHAIETTPVVLPPAIGIYDLPDYAGRAQDTLARQTGYTRPVVATAAHEQWTR